MQFYVPEIQDVVEIKDEADQLIEDELKKFETKLGKSAEQGNNDKALMVIYKFSCQKNVFLYLLIE